MIFPAGVVAELQQIAILIGHIARDADLVSVEVEVVGLLASFVFFVDPVVYLCVPRTLYIEIGGFIRATACFEICF